MLLSFPIFERPYETLCVFRQIEREKQSNLASPFLFTLSLI